MLTEAQRGRLCEWSGIRLCADDSRFIVPCDTEDCLHIESGGTYEDCTRKHVPDYTDWNSVCPLLAKIHRDGNGDEFHSFAFDRCFNSDAPDGADVEAWIMGNYTDPSHTAGLVAEWLERKETDDADRR